MDFDLMAYYIVNNINEPINGIEERNIFQKPLFNPFALTDELFMKNFRLTKELTRYLIDTLEPYIDVKTRLSSIDIDTKVNTKN